MFSDCLKAIYTAHEINIKTAKIIAINPPIQTAARSALFKIGPINSWRVAPYTKLTETTNGNAYHRRFVSATEARSSIMLFFVRWPSEAVACSESKNSTASEGHRTYISYCESSWSSGGGLSDFSSDVTTIGPA